MMWDLSAVVLRVEEFILDKGRAGDNFLFQFIQTDSHTCFIQWLIKITDAIDLCFRGT
jgi:hypothetical protein